MNQPHEVQYVPRWQTITRRLLFVLYLVASGLIILGAGYNGWHETDLFWVGLGSPYVLIALWLTTRANVFRTRLGMCRVLTYAFAFIFGRALYTFKLYEFLTATGQTLLLLIALLTAKFLGIRYSIGARKEPSNSDATINP